MSYIAVYRKFQATRFEHIRQPAGHGPLASFRQFCQLPEARFECLEVLMLVPLRRRPRHKMHVMDCQTAATYWHHGAWRGQGSLTTLPDVPSTQAELSKHIPVVHATIGGRQIILHKCGRRALLERVRNSHTN